MSEETEDLHLPDLIRRRVSVEDLEEVIEALKSTVEALRATVEHIEEMADVLEGKRLANADPQA